MLASKVEKHELGFESSKKDTNGTKYTISTRDIGGLSVRELDPLGVDDYFYEGEIEKQGIVLHFTAGYLRGDMGAMIRQGKHVCVPYLSARSGDVFQIFDPKHCWGYHLGRSAVGGNTTMSKKTVAIEISNIGPLELRGNSLHTAYGDKYCSLDEKQYYTKLAKSWRGYQYYASYTEEQIDSLINLLKHITKRFNIPAEFLPEEKRYRIFSSAKEARAFKGISTHINYRKNGKWDLGPAFPWDRVIKGVQGKPKRKKKAPEEKLDARNTLDLPKVSEFSTPSYPVEQEPAKAEPAQSPQGIVGIIMELISKFTG